MSESQPRDDISAAAPTAARPHAARARQGRPRTREVSLEEGRPSSREHFIPVRKSELIRHLARQPGLTEDERSEFLRVCKVLDATFHFEYQRQLDQLKDAYASFDPDADTRRLRTCTPEQREQLAPQVFDMLIHVLQRANYERLTREEIQNVMGASSDWGLQLDVNFSIFNRLEVFVRGDVVGQRTQRRLLNFYRVEQADVEIYQRLVVIFRLRPHPDLEQNADTQSIYVKLFKNIPKKDVDMLLPGARVRLSLLDRGKIVLPTLSGLLLALVKIIKGTVIFAISGLAGIIAFAIFVAGTLGYGVKSFFGYLRTKDKYQLNLTRNLYYQNLDNNAGVLFRLLDEAEEQECREAVLAYYLLWRHAGAEGWSQQRLDREAERFLQREIGLDDVDFETHDAVAKLLRLGIARERASGCLTALPADLAVSQLDRTWDSCFEYGSPPAAPRDKAMDDMP